MLKHAYSQGADAALQLLGLNKAAGIPQLVGKGLHMLGRGLNAVGKWGQGAAKAGVPAMNTAASGVPNTMANPARRAMNWTGGALRRTSADIHAAGKNFGRDPWGTMGGGIQNTAHGMLLGGGKGIGARVGKGILGTTTASSMIGGSTPPPVNMMPPPGMPM